MGRDSCLVAAEIDDHSLYLRALQGIRHTLSQFSHVWMRAHGPSSLAGALPSMLWQKERAV